MPALPTPTLVPPSPTPTPTQLPIATPVPGYADPEKWLGRTMTVATQGGAYLEAQRVALFEPFAAATGAVVVPAKVDLAELRRQVDEESVAWDLADFPTDEVLPLARAGYLAPIDYQVVDRTPLFAEIVMQYAVGAAFFSTAIAYPAGAPRAPRGWFDFWDVGAFPGARALRRGPIGTLEFALLADGVPMTRLYPLALERAFASLERLRPHVVQWYDNAMQPVALLLNGDVAMASAYSVRGEGEDARERINLQWTGAMLSADSWVVPRGAANRDVAMDLINFATRAIPSANFARLLPFGPVNREALPLVRPDRAAQLPTSDANWRVQFVQNWNWWADHRDSLTARFEEWLLAEPVPERPMATPPAVARQAPGSDPAVGMQPKAGHGTRVGDGASSAG